VKSPGKDGKDGVCNAPHPTAKRRPAKGHTARGVREAREEAGTRTQGSASPRPTPRHTRDFPRLRLPGCFGCPAIWQELKIQLQLGAREVGENRRALPERLSRDPGLPQCPPRASVSSQAWDPSPASHQDRLPQLGSGTSSKGPCVP
jgi:hypothetical protein